MAGLGAPPQHWRSRQRRWLLERVLAYDQALITLVNDGNGGFWLPMREVADTVAKNYAYTAAPGPGVLVNSDFSDVTGVDFANWSEGNVNGTTRVLTPDANGVRIQDNDGSASPTVSLSQLNVAVVGDTCRVRTNIHSIASGRLLSGFNAAGFFATYDSPGQHEVDFIAPFTAVTLQSWNSANPTDLILRSIQLHKVGEMDALIAATTGVRRAGLRGKAQTEGPEALVNGSFEAGSSGWSTIGVSEPDRTVTFANGQCTITSDGGAQISAFQFNLTPGQKYRLTLVISSLTAPSFRLQSTGPGGVVYDNITAIGTHIYEITSQTTGITLTLISGSSGTGTVVIDSVSMIPIMGGQVVVNPSFDDGSTGWSTSGTNGTTRTVSFGSGQCTIVSDGGAACGLLQSANSLSIGQTYRFTIEVTAVTGTLRVSDQNLLVVYQSITTPGTYVFDVVSLGTNLFIYYPNGGSGAATVARVEIMPYPGADAFYFDKANSILTVTNRASLQAMEEFTVAMVLYPFDAGENNVGRFFRKADEFDFLFASSSRNIRAIVDCATTDGDVTTSTAVPALAWSSVIITYSHSGDKTPHVYINGVEASYSSTQASSGNRISNSNNIVIGNAETLAATLSGVVDEALLVKRVLSATEIAQLHTQLTGAAPGQSVAA